MFDHNTFPVLIALSLALYAPNLQTSVLYLKSNVSENGQNHFIALGLLVRSYSLGAIGLLSLHPSGVEKMAASIIAL